LSSTCRELAGCTTPNEPRRLRPTTLSSPRQILGKMHNWLLDIRYGIRVLAGTPGFTAITTLTLALGIGANSIGFLLFNTIILKKLPVRNPESLVLATRVRGPSTGMWFSYSMFEDIKDDDQVFSGAVAFATLGNLTLSIDGIDEQLPGGGQLVSTNFYHVLGVDPALGRVIAPDDDNAQGGSAVAVISYKLWTRRFNRDPSIVGERIIINGTPLMIIGVTPKDFFGPMLGAYPDLYAPISMHSELAGPGAGSPDKTAVQVMARLLPGVAKEAASVSLNNLFDQEIPSNRLGRDERVELVDGSKGVALWRNQFANTLRILVIIGWLLLLIACANVACLLLARTAERQKEIALRLAIGAGPLRLIRQLLTESLLLATLGGGLGLAFALWGSALLLGLVLQGSGAQSITASLDLHTLVYTGAVSLLAVALFGLTPALLANRLDLASILKGGPHRSSRIGISRVLVTAQIAVSFVLLMDTVLLLRSVENLMTVDTGFGIDKVLLVRVDSRASGYRGDRLVTLFKELQERIEALPEVRSASMSDMGALGGFSMRVPISVPGFIAGSDEERMVNENSVGPRYFETLGIRLLQGREFDARDNEVSSRVAVISESLGRKFFGDNNPIGQRIAYGKNSDIEIVGIVVDAKYASLREGPVPTLYFPYLQAKTDWKELEVRTAVDPTKLASSVRQEIMAVDRRLPILQINTLADRVDRWVVQERLALRLLSLFVTLAMFLVCVAIWGLESRSVARRTKEMGIRIALGALPGSIVRLVLKESLVMVLIGLALGVPSAILNGRLLSSMLFGVGSTDPAAMSCAALAMISVAILASIIPARKATRVDPAVILAAE
jgi:predicted permease